MDRVVVNLARIQNPALVQYQKNRLLNERDIKGLELDGVAGHSFSVDHLPKYEIPDGDTCFWSEGTSRRVSGAPERSGRGRPDDESYC